MLEEYLVWRILLVGSDEILVILSLDVSFNIPLFIIPNSVFGIVIMYFSETLMYEMDLCCNSFSLLDPWGKMWNFRALPRGVSDGYRSR